MTILPVWNDYDSGFLKLTIRKMKHYTRLIILLAGIIAASCSNDMDCDMDFRTYRMNCEVLPFEWAGGNTAGRLATKAQKDEEALHFLWSANDTIGIYPNEGTQQAFPIAEGADTYNAVFDGGGWALRPGNTYAAYYPYNKYNFDPDHITLRYGTQTQKGNDNVDNLTRYDYIVAQMEAPEDGEVNFQFHHLGALVRFTLKCPQEGSFHTLMLESDEEVFPTLQTLDIRTATPTVMTKEAGKSFMMMLADVSVAAGGDVVIYALFPALDLRGKTFTATLYGSDYTCRTTLTGKNMLSGKAYSYSTTMETITLGTCNGYEWVDLGLPSGIKWASCNVGTTLPEGYGDYFAWGETVPQAYGDATSFIWKNYKHCMGSYTTLTKYCWRSAEGYNGFTDMKYTLDPEDDAAASNWVKPWRMPTQEEEVELKKECTWQWGIRNGVTGYTVTSKINGRSIFLPTTGYCQKGSFYRRGTEGDFWLSSLSDTDTGTAYAMEFTSNNYSWEFSEDRSFGRPVRPVLP